jgi:hypothetical protein
MGIIPRGNRLIDYKAILQSGSIEKEQQNNNSKLSWVIGGVAVVSLALIVGYLVGKRRKTN